ncbi:hypothetical protein KUV95_12505 [Microbulbifer agarilyticus]|uniref:hypothetical protein n=1 Tax=Microbulbifer agarilyticus TaxID=260552 RepID=UPI001C949E6A|nr:hypothetical protein [Microbulbifer agarilyticus]MBY6212372.1 hypothetical protein [Microbulbifer agarilyticus]
MFQGQTIAQIRIALTEGQVTNDAVIGELEARHARHLAKGKGSTWPARVLYRELTGKELPGTRLLKAATKSVPAQAPAKRSVAVKARASGKAALAAVPAVDADLAARYAKTSTAQLKNWLRKAQEPKASAIRAELAKREEPKTPAKPAKASASDLERAKQALAGLSQEHLVAFLSGLPNV